jgi:hypothetical protein
MRLKILILLVLLGVSAPMGVADAIVSVFPSASTVNPGDTVIAYINVTGVVDLYGFQFDLNFNPAIIAAGSVSEGPFLGLGGFTFFIAGNIDNVGGSITNTADTLLGPVPGVNGDGTLATAQFTAIAAGQISLGVSNVLLVDSQGNPISTVPEPATLALAVVGAAWLIFVARRKMLN